MNLSLTPQEITCRDTYRDERGKVRVMAIAEDYVLYRRPHAYPRVMHRAEFAKHFWRDE